MQTGADFMQQLQTENLVVYFRLKMTDLTIFKINFN